MTDLLDNPEPPAAATAPSTERVELPVTVAPAPALRASGSRLVDGYLTSGRDLDILTAPIGRTIVVVPHPDDEALAAGGLIAHQRAHGRDVVVVAVTDGDAAYPDWRGEELARVRRREQLDALHALGVGRQAVHRLGMPDGATDLHVEDIAAELLGLVGASDTLVAPAAFDRHPDHEACGRAATAVADAVGCSLLGSLVGAHHDPEHAPADLTLGVLALSDDEVARRMAAVTSHRSQLLPSHRTVADPILSRASIALLERPLEYYVLGRAVPAGAA
jgi:LmbE family N-acetylglucosaminyl deacetylase